MVWRATKQRSRRAISIFACFLRCTGYDLIDLRAEGRRKVFIFCDRSARRDDVLLRPGRGDSAAGVFRNQSKI